MKILYDKWIDDYAKKHRVLIINTDDFDIEQDNERLNNILKGIGAYEYQLELFPNLSRI